MDAKSFLDIREEETIKLNTQFLEYLKLVMGLNPFCNKFEFVFSDVAGKTVHGDAGYYTEIKHPKAFDDVIFHNMVRNDQFFEDCEIFKYETKDGFCESDNGFVGDRIYEYVITLIEELGLSAQDTALKICNGNVTPIYQFAYLDGYENIQSCNRYENAPIDIVPLV